jgi:hypothetical protein
MVDSIGNKSLKRLSFIILRTTPRRKRAALEDLRAERENAIPLFTRTASTERIAALILWKRIGHILMRHFGDDCDAHEISEEVRDPGSLLLEAAGVDHVIAIVLLLQ